MLYRLATAVLHLDRPLCVAVIMTCLPAVGIADPGSLVTVSCREVAAQVSGHLAAREFGAAQELTRRVPDLSEQKTLKRIIATVQQTAGEASHKGGGSTADFSML